MASSSATLAITGLMLGTVTYQNRAHYRVTDSSQMGMRIGEVLTVPHSPWQNPFVERSDAVQDKAILAVMAYGRLRRGEVVTLDVGDFDPAFGPD